MQFRLTRKELRNWGDSSVDEGASSDEGEGREAIAQQMEIQVLVGSLPKVEVVLVPLRARKQAML